MRICIILAYSFAAALLAQTGSPETIYYNGKVVTVWDKSPTAEAFAIRGGRFLAVGSNEEVQRLAGPQTRKVDLHGRSVLPGLIDSHVHPIGAALSEIDGPVPVMNSIADVQNYVRKQAASLPPDRLVFVPKVYASRLKEQRYPTRQELDEAAPQRAAVADNGYASVLNSMALKRVGVTRDTPQPKNGRIVKDPSGEPTGLILGASDLLASVRRTRPTTHADMLWALKSMQKKYNEVGLTSVIDRGQHSDGFRAYQELHDKNELTVRSYVTYLIGAQGTPKQVREEIERIPFVTGWGDDKFRVGSLKTILDGGILIGTAYLREPYGTHTQLYGFEDPDYRGVLSVPRENLMEMAQVANELGWQMTAHTTGGGATDLLLDAYEATDRKQPIKGRRFTVTHGNFPNAAAIERARRLGVAFDVQPAWMHLDGAAIAPVFGPARMRDFMPIKSMLDAGLVVAGGSDHMIRFDPRNAINPFHPFYGIWMAMTRRTVAGTVLNPDQRVSRMRALQMWTINAAYLSFDEKEKGSIEPGKLADFVILAQDFLNIPEDAVKDIEPIETVLGGETVYRRQ